jgi:two-component system OmpR family response regulator
LRILLIEDELGLGDAVRIKLLGDGHAVDWAQTSETAAELVLSKLHELVLLDLNLPDGSGLQILRTMRSSDDRRPVIIVTARDQLSDRIDGLKSGADDYIVKPFYLDELVARVDAVHRRSLGNPNPTIKIGDILIDRAMRQVSLNEEVVPLTAREWALLTRLAERPGAIVTKAQLEDSLYEFGTEVESNTVEVYVSRLRRKFGRNIISTVRGLGYRLRDV